MEVTDQKFIDALKVIENGIDLEEIWDDGLQNRGLDQVLDSIGDRLGLNLSNASEAFQEKTHAYDQEDVLPQNLNLSAFRRRLGNFLIEKQYQQNQLTEPDLTEYIRMMREKYTRGGKAKAVEKMKEIERSQEEEVKIEIPLQREDSFRDFQEDEIQMQPSVELQLEQREEKPQIDVKIEQDQIDEKPLFQDPPLPPKIKTEKLSSWINLWVKFHKIQLEKAYDKRVSENTVNLADINFIVQDFLNIIKLNVKDPDMKDLYKEFRKKFDAATNADLSSILQLLATWANKHPHIPHQYQNMLQKTLIQYKNLSNKLSPIMKKHAQDFTTKLQTIIKNFTHGKSKNPQALSKDQHHGLSQIFSFYAKAIVNFGVKPTFEQIQSNNNI